MALPVYKKIRFLDRVVLWILGSPYIALALTLPGNYGQFLFTSDSLIVFWGTLREIRCVTNQGQPFRHGYVWFPDSQVGIRTNEDGVVLAPPAWFNGGRLYASQGCCVQEVPIKEGLGSVSLGGCSTCPDRRFARVVVSQLSTDSIRSKVGVLFEENCYHVSGAAELEMEVPNYESLRFWVHKGGELLLFPPVHSYTPAQAQPAIELRPQRALTMRVGRYWAVPFSLRLGGCLVLNSPTKLRLNMTLPHTRTLYFADMIIPESSDTLSSWIFIWRDSKSRSEGTYRFKIEYMSTKTSEVFGTTFFSLSLNETSAGRSPLVTQSLVVRPAVIAVQVTSTRGEPIGGCKIESSYDTVWTDYRGMARLNACPGENISLILAGCVFDTTVTSAWLRRGLNKIRLRCADKAWTVLGKVVRSSITPVRSKRTENRTTFPVVRGARVERPQEQMDRQRGFSVAWDVSGIQLPVWPSKDVWVDTRISYDWRTVQLGVTYGLDSLPEKERDVGIFLRIHVGRSFGLCGVVWGSHYDGYWGLSFRVGDFGVLSGAAGPVGGSSEKRAMKVRYLKWTSDVLVRHGVGPLGYGTVSLRFSVIWSAGLGTFFAGGPLVRL